MAWVTNRVYSFNSIVRALDNRKNNAVDNAKYPLFEANKKFDKVIVVGGGNSVVEHFEGIKEFIDSDTALIFSTARHAALFADVNCHKYYALVGTESRRMARNVRHEGFKDAVILPPYPRTMGTEVPDFAKTNTYELSSVNFIKEYTDSSTTIAFETALLIALRKVYCIGYDGYPGSVLSEKEMSLTHENMSIFNAFSVAINSKLKSLTPSLYKELDVESIYMFI